MTGIFSARATGLAGVAAVLGAALFLVAPKEASVAMASDPLEGSVPKRVPAIAEFKLAQVNWDQKTWDEIKNSTDPEPFDLFIAAFPDRANVPAARARLYELRSKLTTAPVTECDRLAADPYDPERVKEVAGVEIGKIDVARATLACDEAMAEFPSVGRFALQAGRVAGARNDFPLQSRLYEQAAAQGHALAMQRLGNIFSIGVTLPLDYAKAKRWYEKAAALGNAGAMFSLGGMHEAGLGVPASLTEALKWYEKAAALGNAGAMFSLGGMHEAGRGVPASLTEALSWYRKAAERGYQPAKEKVDALSNKSPAASQKK